MANARNESPVQTLLTNADNLAAEYDSLRKQMLEKRAATRAAATMAKDLAAMLGEPTPELSPAVVKVMAKRQPRKGSDDDAVNADED